MDDSQTEKLITELATMGRQQLIDRLRGLRCSFPLDFTDEFLMSEPLNRLRHIVLAAWLQQQRDMLRAR
jgi:hypothetical protein